MEISRVPSSFQGSAEETRLEQLLAFADRTRVLPEQYRKTVIRMNGDVAQTFLVDGLVAGVWRVESGRVVAEPFSALPRSVRRELEDEAVRLEAFLAD